MQIEERSIKRSVNPDLDGKAFGSLRQKCVTGIPFIQFMLLYYSTKAMRARRRVAMTYNQNSVIWKSQLTSHTDVSSMHSDQSRAREHAP